MGLLTYVCETCGHRHGRLTERCMQPRCRCLGRRADRIRRRLYGEGKMAPSLSRGGATGATAGPPRYQTAARLFRRFAVRAGLAPFWRAP